MMSLRRLGLMTHRYDRKKYWLHGGGYFECDISLNRGSSSISPQQTTTHTTTPTKCTRLNQNSTRYQNLKQKLPHNHDRFRSLKWTEKDKNGLKMVLNGIITMNYVTSHFDCSQTDVFKRRNSTNEDFHRIYAIFDQNRTISRWKWPISHRN